MSGVCPAAASTETGLFAVAIPAPFLIFHFLYKNVLGSNYWDNRCFE
jgi:hypothetical protein